MIDFEARIRELDVAADRQPGGTLVKASQYEFTYAAGARRRVSLLMSPEKLSFRDGELFAVMDMNLPEGFLLARIRERSPKVAPTKMQLLGLAGRNGIGWLQYAERGVAPAGPAPAVDRAGLLRDGLGRNGRVFDRLVDAYLSTGSGLSGVQPKILVPERASIPVPNLLVKAESPEYPGLSGNEFLCLEVARRAGLDVAGHALSDDGRLLVIDRFDLAARGRRYGFEDIAALLDLRVGGALSDRKYKGSYEDVARVVEKFVSNAEQQLARLFDAVALSVLVGNGDAHLKNFAVLYDDVKCWLAPIYDVVTTTLYPYERADGVRMTDRTMALKLRQGDKGRAYPLPEALYAFGAEVCRVARPRARVLRLVDAMADTLRSAPRDERLKAALKRGIVGEWQGSMRVFSRA